MSYNSELQGNNEELQVILDKINDLPDASSMVSAAVSEHNVNEEAHNDIRLLLQGLADRMNEIVADVKASLPKLTMVGTDADGVEHTWTIYGS